MGAARKYILYATGEVLLVMIGILLALQVNNWNDERKAIVERNKLHNDLINAVYYDLLDEVSMISNSINRLTLQKDLSLMVLKSIESQDHKSLDSTRLWNAVSGNLTPPS